MEVIHEISLDVTLSERERKAIGTLLDKKMNWRILQESRLLVKVAVEIQDITAAKRAEKKP